MTWDDYGLDLAALVARKSFDLAQWVYGQVKMQYAERPLPVS